MVRIYWSFNHGFTFQDSVCNVCHDLTMLRLNIRNIAIITAKGITYLIYNNSRSEATNLYIYILKIHIKEIESTTILTI